MATNVGPPEVKRTAWPTGETKVAVDLAGMLMVPAQPIDSATPVAVAVAVPTIVTVVPLMTAEMRVPAGIPAPPISEPTSAAVKEAVAEVTVLLPLVVTPSATLRPHVGVTVMAEALGLYR